MGCYGVFAIAWWFVRLLSWRVVRFMYWLSWWCGFAMMLLDFGLRFVC